MNITPELIQELKAKGYTDKEIERAIYESQREEEEDDFQNEYQRAMQQRGVDYGQHSTFQYNPSDNLIKWQLELNDILERAEHILKEDIVEVKDGNVIWKPNPHPEERIFNEYAVQEIMRVLSMYINRNTILSDYEPDEIMDKVYDFGKEINDLVFMKYEHFGLLTQEKRKNYPMLIRQLIDIVHSSYKRAQYGGERESLRTARSIQQQEQIFPQGFDMGTGGMKKERSILNPMRLLKGKYV